MPFPDASRCPGADACDTSPQAGGGLASPALRGPEEGSEAPDNVRGEVVFEWDWPNAQGGTQGGSEEGGRVGPQHSWTPYLGGIWRCCREWFEVFSSASGNAFKGFWSAGVDCWNAFTWFLSEGFTWFLSEGFCVVGCAVLWAVWMDSFGCLWLAQLVVTVLFYPVWVCLCLVGRLVSHAVGHAVDSGDWLLWSLWDGLLRACGCQRSFFFEAPSASDIKVQWEGRTESWKGAVRYQRAARAAAEHVAGVLSCKWRARRVILSVLREAGLGRGRLGGGAMCSVQVKGIILRPGGAVQVQWVVGGRAVTREEAVAHRAKGRTALSAPELRGGGGGVGDEPGAYAGVGGHATPGGGAGAAVERTPEQRKEHEAGLCRLGINTVEVSRFCGLVKLPCCAVYEGEGTDSCLLASAGHVRAQGHHVGLRAPRLADACGALPDLEIVWETSAVERQADRAALRGARQEGGLHLAPLAAALA